MFLKLSRSRFMTLWLLGMVALLTLAGAGKQILAIYEGLNQSDRLAELSLFMAGMPADAQPVTLLAVDDATRLAWGDRLETPHDALANLISVSASNKARAILVDFDLSSDKPDLAMNVALRDALQNFPRDGSLLMLVRKVRFTRDTSGNGDIAADDAGRTPYDDVVQANPNIRWVTTLNDYTANRTVSNLRLWQSSCRKDKPFILPSPTLVMAGMGVEGQPLDGFLQAQLAADCGGTKNTSAGWPAQREQAVAIPYIFGAVDGNAARYSIVQNGQTTTAFQQVSARLLVVPDGTSFKLAGEADPAPFQNRVVLIGATHSDSGDFHKTPIGTMPGVVVLANSLIGAKAMVNHKPTPSWVKNVLAMLLMLVLVGLNHRLIGPIMVVLVSVVSFFCVMLAARSFGFTTAIGMVAVALVGFGLFKLLDGLVKALSLWPQKGWRSILKD